MSSTLTSGTFIQLVDVHGVDERADMGRAAEAALLLYPKRRIVAVRRTAHACRHGYLVWAVEVAGPDPRIVYVAGLCGPPIRDLLEVNDGAPRDIYGECW